ncbi:hypothetical protein GF366_04845 [Candidatus Peregrinibacteria bacterium]|nr:hypothetical protein [Candidatus Peregrinibacteria bacterium]
MLKKNKEKVVSIKQRIKSLFSLKNVLILLIAVFFLFQYFQIQSLLGTFSFLQSRDSSLVTEIGQLKEVYLTMGEDLNEIREFLRMPKKDYVGFEEPKQVDEDGQDKNKDEVQMAMFQYIDYLASEKNKEQKLENNKSLMEALTGNEEILNFLNENKLAFSSIVEDDNGYYLKINDNEKRTLVTISLLKNDPKLSLETVNTISCVDSETSEEFHKEILDYLEGNVESLKKFYDDVEEKKTKIANAISAEETQNVLNGLDITLSSEPIESDLEIVYPVYSKSENLIGEVVLDPASLNIKLIDKNDSSLSITTTDIAGGLVPFLEKLDTKTFIEKKVEESMESLKKTLNDEGFRLLLSESGLSISEEMYEDEDRYYYDIFDSEGNVLSSIVIEKSTGVINIVKPDGTNAENLLFFDPEFKKKTLEIPEEIPEYSDQVFDYENSFNILIAGKHGNLVDTMIFAHVDEEKREVRMISIPRDLYYNGRKINSFAYYYGMSELKKVLSDMTGYELDKYILIDMYAFIDVIDLVGGIDIHLDKPVIDPTYRTVDNGVEGTLHYEPGDYHLGGVEALRLARSRHTSSDFARAERQQLILTALQNKAKNFGFGDADTIYEIAKTVLSKTETDIGIDEAIAYYFRYQNYEIISNDVMSSGNVLYVPPYITVSNCEKLIAEAKTAGQPIPGCMNQNHAYTLLPRNNNWNIIKWFFREKFETV